MPRVLDTYPPLQQLCRNAGAEPEDVAAAVKAITGEDITSSGVVAFLRRGTRNVDYLNAISRVTGLPLQVVAEAGKKIGENYFTSQYIP